MRIKLSDLYSSRGRIGRERYAIYGLILFAMKYNVDRLIAIHYFGRVWGPLDYLNHDRNIFSVSDTNLYLTLILVALPFIWTGAALTLRRLRDAGFQPWQVAFFFLPFINLVFFIALSLAPTRNESEVQENLSWLHRMIPKSEGGKDRFAIFFSGAATLPFLLVSVIVFRKYGLALFMGIPFFVGFLVTTIGSYERRITWTHGLFLTFGALAMQALIMLAIAFEGVVCLAMAFPIAFVLGTIGMSFALAITRVTHSRHAVASIYSFVLVLPIWIAMEGGTRQAPPTIEAVTTVDIQAPPEIVWKNVVEFAELPEPSELLFKTGIAYPIRARITGRGVGAVRKCEFSTGPFVEPITTWQEPSLLAFDVRSSPPPMKEFSFWDIHPPHLDNFMISKHGQFRLVPLPNGGTRLIGTTWYTHAIWPTMYWSVFSDYIIHTIHTRVLEHIKNLSEGNAQPVE